VMAEDTAAWHFCLNILLMLKVMFFKIKNIIYFNIS
jgi:hypothetical protein